MTLALLTAAISHDARADDPVAEQLYEQGRDAVRDKNWALACEKFRASEDREPAPGTLLNLADCEEHQGKLVDALAHFDSSARLFHAGDDRVAFAKQRAAAVRVKLAKLTVRIDPRVAGGTVVELDGVALGPSSLGSPMEVDPGEHVLVARAPQHAPSRSTVRLAEGEARELDLGPGAATAPQGAPLPAATTSPSGARPSAIGATPPPRPDAIAGTRTVPWRTIGYVSLAAGAVALGVGTVGGFLTLSAKSSVAAECTPGCSGDGLRDERSGKAWSTVGTIGFVAGAVGLATGGALILYFPSAKRTHGAVAIQPAEGGAELRWRTSF